MKVITESQCKEELSAKEAIDITLDVFKNLDKVVQPLKQYIYLLNGDIRIMPAYLKYKETIGTKLVTCYPKNKEYPTVNSITILINHENGTTEAVVESTYLTALRTGASGAIATKYLVNRNDISIALVGAGMQAYTQLLCHLELIDISKIYISDIDCCKSEMLRNSFNDLDVDIVISDIETACKNADVVITTTPVREPIIFDEWINDGIHINAIGADAKGKQELDHRILCRENTIIVCDSIEQCKHAGEINVSYNCDKEVVRLLVESNIECDMHDLVTRGIKLYGNEVTVYDSTGIAALDVAFAREVNNLITTR